LIDDTEQDADGGEATITSKSDAGNKPENQDSQTTDEKSAAAAESNLKEQDLDSTPENEQSKSSEIKSDVQVQELPSISPHEEFYNQWRRFNIDLTSKVSIRYLDA